MQKLDGEKETNQNGAFPALESRMKGEEKDVEEVGDDRRAVLEILIEGQRWE